MKVLMWMGGNFDRRTPSEHLLVAIVEALYKKGNDVHIIQKDTGGELPKIPIALKNLEVTSDCIPCKLASKKNFVFRYLIELWYVWKSIKFIKKQKECLAVFNQSSNVAGVMAYIIKKYLPNARLTYNVQDIFPENVAYTGKIRRIVYKILSAEQMYAYKKADQIITISEDMKELLIEKGISERKIKVIYNWSYQDELYDRQQTYNEEIAKILHSDEFNVVYAGNIGIMQNVDILVNTARIMQDDKSVRFHIIGDGVYKEKLMAKAKSLKNISFWPMQPSSLAPSIYSMADINVIPLAKNIYRTALPSKTATCLACQKPIIFCFDKYSKFGKWMQEEAGCLLVDSDDEEALREAILHIKENGLKENIGDVFEKFFSRTINSNIYADYITDNRSI